MLSMIFSAKRTRERGGNSRTCFSNTRNVMACTLPLNSDTIKRRWTGASSGRGAVPTTLETGHVDQIQNLDSAIFLRQGDGPPAWHQPQEIRMLDLETALIGNE